MSRPKKDQTRSSSYRLRLYPEEKKIIDYLAKKNEMSVADLIRTGLNSIMFEENIKYRKGSYA